MPSDRHQLLSAVYVVLRQGESILMLRRYNTGFEDGNYSFVAGHIDKGETAYDAAIREAKEEAGIDVHRSSLQLLHTLHRHGSENYYIDLFIQATSWEGEITNKEPEKCDDLSWFEMQNLPDNTVTYINLVLDRINNGELYSEFGWPDA